MDLAQFMEHVGARPAAVARGAGVHISTVMRVRDKEQTPDGITLARLSRWADDVSRRLGLTASEKLSWDYLVNQKRTERDTAA